MGTPAFLASARLTALSSSAFMARELGPMNRMLQLSQTSAKWAFSDKKPVAGMDGVHVGDFRRADDAVDAQVALAAGRFADADGFVGQLDVHGVGIRLGINGHRADVQFLAGADDADGDFSAIGYQNFFKHAVVGKTVSPAGRSGMPTEPAHQVGRILNNGWPNSTGLAFSTRTWVMTPLASALISFITFIASMMQTTVSGFTSVPTST